jgi:hypothetical protein
MLSCVLLCTYPCVSAGQDETNLDDLQFGSKMVLLMDILKECELIGDKVIISYLIILKTKLCYKHNKQALLICYGQCSGSMTFLIRIRIRIRESVQLDYGS